MFGIGGTELIIILIFAFLVFGPDKMPALAKPIGGFLRKFHQGPDCGWRQAVENRERRSQGRNIEQGRPQQA